MLAELEVLALVVAVEAAIQVAVQTDAISRARRHRGERQRTAAREAPEPAIGGPGAVYGIVDASQLTMGSGQSGGLDCAGGVTGPPTLISEPEPLAGGIVLLIANELNIGSGGEIIANANNSSRDVSASGGYVFLRGSSLSLGTARVTATGGIATGTGGTLAAGDGYIVVSSTTVTGTTKPNAHQL